ncbi:MAG: EamA family transporter [Novosphingobium sp.]
MTSVQLGILLALASAFATAFSHAYLKAGTDKLAVQAWIRLTGLAAFGPVALAFGTPPASLMPWIVAAALVHALYQWVLIHSYRLSDFSIAYPLARGTAPLFTLLFAVVMLKEVPSFGTVLGVVLLCSGILALVRHGTVSLAGAAVAGLTGLLTTAYSLIDAKGVRLADSALHFIAWFYVADGFSMPALLAIRDGGRIGPALKREAAIGIKAGLLALAAFVPALFAFRLAPVGAVAALRETSVLIGLVLGGTMLKEAIDLRRAIGALMILAGGVMVALWSAG